MGHGNIRISESIEIDPAVNINIFTHGFKTPNRSRVSNFTINGFPQSQDQFSLEKILFRGREVKFYKLEHPLDYYVSLKYGASIAWTIDFNFTTKYQLANYDSMGTCYLEFFRPSQLESKKSKVIETTEVEILDKNFPLAEFIIADNAQITKRNLYSLVYKKEYIRKDLEIGSFIIVREPCLSIDRNVLQIFNVRQLKRIINLSTIDQVEDIHEFSFSNGVNSKPVLLNLRTKKELDLTNSDIKLTVDDQPKTPVQIDSNLFQSLQLGKAPNPERYLYYYGKTFIPIDSVSKSIILYYPLEQNQIINTKIKYEYNPQKLNTLIPIDAFHFLFKCDLEYFSIYKGNNDILEISIPESFVVNKTNYNSKIIPSLTSDRKLVFKGLNKVSNTQKQLKIEFTRVGTKTLDVLYIINITLTILGGVIIISYLFIKRIQILNILSFIGICIFPIITIFLGLFSLELFWEMIFYTWVLPPLIMLVVIYFLQRYPIKLVVK